MLNKMIESNSKIKTWNSDTKFLSNGLDYENGYFGYIHKSNFYILLWGNISVNIPNKGKSNKIFEYGDY